MHFFRFLLLVFICSRDTLFLNAFSCDGGCSEHGICEHSTGRCICFPDFTGATCASRLCPMGAAWVDRAWTIDKAHQPAECSAMGRCDRLTGICICESGFEGLACERLACPNSCSGNGRCVSIRDAAELYDDRNFFVRTTYTLWDADKIMGCQCDPGYIGFDCSERECPKGDNPFTTTTQDHAIQELTCICNSCSGTFTLSFQSQVTTNIAATATSSDLKMALETLDNIYGLDIVSATPLCSNSGTTTSITFTHNPGDVPLLQVKSTLNSGTITLITSQVGTRENAYCSNRGICDFATGVCKCIAGFTSGNGGLPPLPGRRGDCGYPLGAPICPTTSNGVCDNKGTCSSGTSYECICLSGFTGYDCSLRECPKGAAWFDGATAPDTAHALSFCSNKGRCDTTTGRCVCVAPFTGAACDLIQCPSGTSLNSGGSCSGRGTCKNIQQLSLEAKDHAGNLLGVTYGAIPNTLATWDATKIQGCDCDLNDYFGPYELAYGDLMGGHDCNVRTCPRGADPFESGKVNEKQTINCIADGGYFTLTFRQETTLVIPFDANVARVQATFETLQSVRGAIVTFDTGTVACSATGVVITIEFTFMQGDLPLLNIDTSGLTLSGNPTTLTVAELVKGTKANIECSARGICDRGTGICACFPYFLSSNGAGGPGRRGDCGFISPYPSTTIS